MNVSWPSGSKKETKPSKFVVFQI